MLATGTPTSHSVAGSHPSWQEAPWPAPGAGSSSPPTTSGTSTTKTAARAGLVRVTARATDVKAGSGWSNVGSGNGHRAGLEEEPLRWSQRWFDDPPVGTIKLGHRPWEINVGSGVWVEIDEA